MITPDFVAALRSAPVNDDDLKASLLGGWNEHLPAIQDERGTLLVGNRRMAIATANDITPVLLTIHFGDGPEADAARARLAVVSNTGAAAITPADRKRVAAMLYGQEMTQAQIAQVMGVSQSQVQRDLEGLPVAGKPPHRPKGGRPRSSGVKAIAAPKPRALTSPDAVEREQTVSTLMDQGLTTSQIGQQIGLGERNTAQVIEHVRIAKEARAEGFAEGVAKAVIDPKAFFPSAQAQATQLAERYYEKVYATFDHEVKEAVERMTRAIRADIAEREATAKRVTDKRGRVMTAKDYNLVTRCLHPDTSKHVSEAERTAAINLWLEKKPLVLIEAEAPMPQRDPRLEQAMQTALSSEKAQRAYAKTAARRAQMAKLKAQQAVAGIVAEVEAEAQNFG